ncbi:MAG: GNAT family N-acetyltransferase [Methanoregulaceae archaeon]|jgi:GNAT superfamily N-acetyltransferase|nr:GNAT family N-acetyltransferase [Methanoregulaceae archaeon]
MNNAGTGDRIEVLLVKKWDTEDIRSLYREAGWWKEEWDPVHLDLLVVGSLAFAVAVDHETGCAVAMGRAISDGCSDAYIQDLVVKSGYRESGIGRKILSALVTSCQALGITWIALIAEPGTEQFYVPSGFERMEGYVPMIFKGLIRGETSNADQT